MHATILMNFRCNMLSERSQIQKIASNMIPFIYETLEKTQNNRNEE